MTLINEVERFKIASFKTLANVLCRDKIPTLNIKFNNIIYPAL